MIFHVFLLFTIVSGGLPPETRVEELERIIGFEFENKLLLQEAMIHSSCGILFNNERLSWIGDAVLFTVISELIFSTYPQQKTKELHNQRENLITRTVFHDNAVSEGFNIQDYLEVCNNNLEKPSKIMLSEFFEAVFGAVFEDCKSLKTVYDLYKEKFPLQADDGDQQLEDE